jgi:M6 family metalloprotease-like protein
MKHWFLRSALLLFLSTAVNSAPASPLPNVYKQPDGTDTPEIYLHGDEKYSWLSDAKGYTVLRDDSGWYVYAKKTASGWLESAGARVGKVNPKKMGLKPDLLDDKAFEEESVEEEESFRRRLGQPENRLCKDSATEQNPCYLKQLALLVRFKDHTDRKLPSPEEIDILFNHNGPTGNSTARTGSVADIYRANSFDTFVLDTHVSPWQHISKTEAYAAGGKNGFNLQSTRECWAEALNMYAQSLTADGLNQFDGDEDGSTKDGFIDGMAVVHSGVAAEEQGEDCETGAIFVNRIWSHAVPQSNAFEFLSNNDYDLGIKVGRFYVISGVHKTCPPGGAFTQWDTRRIATGVHEAGHFVGLPDLYGKPGKDNGIGNWGFMGTFRSQRLHSEPLLFLIIVALCFLVVAGNSYGWDASQNYPGLMGAYSRLVLGWVDIIDITYSQEIKVTASCDSDKIYRIKHRMVKDDSSGDEYLLIENRYACGHDVKLLHNHLDRQGIAIWYVDDTKLLGQNAGRDVIRYNTNKPPDDEAWPAIHSRLSLLQGDGEFELEKNKNRGNEYDMFRKDASSTGAYRAYKITNDGVLMNDGTTKLYPNTNSIAHGYERPTGITIEVLTEPMYDMAIMITLVDEDGNTVTESNTSTGDNQGSNGSQEGDSGQGQGEGQGENSGNNSAAAEDPQSGLQEGGASSGTLGSGSINTIGNAASIFNGFEYSENTNASNSETEATDNSESTVPDSSELAVPDNSEPAATDNSDEASDNSSPPGLGAESNGEKAGVAEESNSGAASANAGPDPTLPPVVDTTPAQPEASSFSCDNSISAMFQFTDDAGVTKFRECQFINPEKRLPAEWCNIEDELNDKKFVYERCQRQCHEYTGCPPPETRKRNLRI